MAATFQVAIGYTDAKGAQSRVKNFITADTDAHALAAYTLLVNAIDPLTQATLTSAQGIGGILTISGAYGSPSLFDSVTDKLISTFIDAAGQLHRFSVPSPKSTLFLADGLTVDPANTDYVAYVNVITNFAANPGFVSTRGGLAFSSWGGGLRTKRANRKRMTVFTKDGNLTGRAE